MTDELLGWLKGDAVASADRKGAIVHDGVLRRLVDRQRAAVALKDLFRAMIRLNNASAIMNGDKASEEALAQHASPVDVITAWIDTRFGATRRRIGSTPHGPEINDIAFQLATDIMIEVSYESNRKVSELFATLCRLGRIVLREGFTYERIGRLIGDGARGVNQARPSIPNDEIAGRYRDVVEVILFGCAVPAPPTPSDQPRNRTTTAGPRPSPAS